MKHLLQSFKNGKTRVVEIPCPVVKAGTVLVRTLTTLISAGTERMLIDFGKASLLSKARQQPEKVKEVLLKIKTDGLATTLEAVRSKLDQPISMGYSHVGVVVEVGAGVSEFQAGDRIVSNGNHAEMVRVPVNLCAKIPNNVSDREASFTVLGAIALQGVRLIKPTLGETVVVTGLGLLGLLAVQILKANGCKVIGLDFDQDRLRLAEQFGALTVDLGKNSDVIQSVINLNNGQEVDAVIITASTSSHEPMKNAASMCRKRGRIVLVGVTGLHLDRSDFYEKEITFQVSCSYGPGRYDEKYEDEGHDYPIGFVRWTEQRNFSAILELMAEKKLNINPLITHEFPFEQVPAAYDLISSAEEKSLGVLLTYTSQSDLLVRQVPLTIGITNTVSQKPVVGVIGAGNYATRILIPAFKSTSAVLQSVATTTGINGYYSGKKFGFRETTTDLNTIWNNKDINTVIIATQHDSHAKLTVAALKAAKHVFVEKPLCLRLSELDEIAEAMKENSGQILMVGFNRRFSPLTKKMHELLIQETLPKAFVMTVNAGFISADHWIQDMERGGGRIIGEACHFIDLLRYLAGSPIVDFHVDFAALKGNPVGDIASINLKFEDGSIGTIHYFANGHKAVPKERLEVFCAGKVLVLNNFVKLTGHGWKGFRTLKLLRQDKGQKECAQAFISAIEKGSPSPIPREEVIEVSRLSIEVAHSIHNRLL